MSLILCQTPKENRERKGKGQGTLEVLTNDFAAECFVGRLSYMKVLQNKTVQFLSSHLKDFMIN